MAKALDNQSGPEDNRRPIRITKATDAELNAAFGKSDAGSGPVEPTGSAPFVTESAAGSATVNAGRRRPKATKATVAHNPIRRGPQDEPVTVSEAVADVATEAAKQVAHMSLEEAKGQATFLLGAVEIAGVMVAGPVGEMSPFERGVMEPCLARILQRMPLNMVARGGVLIDSSMLLIGGAMYYQRVRKGMPSPNVAQQQQPSQPVQVRQPNVDTVAPQAAPVDQTVASTKPGDVDGIAVPVPSIITEYMNGSI